MSAFESNFPDRIESGFAAVFQNHYASLLADWKFWVGSLLFAVCRCCQGIHCQNKEIPRLGVMLGTFGMNLCILSLVQYYGGGMSGMGIITAVLTDLFIDYQRSTSYRMQQHYVQTFHDKTASWKAQNIYQKLDGSCIGAVMRFIGQTILMALYLYHIFKLDLTSVSYTFWLIAFITVQVTFDSPEGQLGDSWQPFFWGSLTTWMEEPEFEGLIVASALSNGAVPVSAMHDNRHLLLTTLLEEQNRRGAHAFLPERSEINARILMDFFVNSFYRTVLQFTVPLLLMKSASALDLVKDALAVAFITTLDDINETTYVQNARLEPILADSVMQRYTSQPSQELAPLASGKQRQNLTCVGAGR